MEPFNELLASDLQWGITSYLKKGIYNSQSTEKEKKKEFGLKKAKEDRGESAHNIWRLGRPEKFAGMLPVSLLLDKSLHILIT